MNGASSTFKITVEKAINTRLAPSIIRQAARAAGAVAIDLIRKRSRRGIGADGKKMRGYSARYKKYKAKVIRGKAGISDSRTPFAAKSVSDFMALSGRTKTDMYVRKVTVKGTGKNADEITAVVVIDFRSNRSRNIVEWHAGGRAGRRGSPKRDIRGLAAANSAQGRKERLALKRAIKGALKLPQNKKIKVG